MELSIFSPFGGKLFSKSQLVCAPQLFNVNHIFFLSLVSQQTSLIDVEKNLSNNHQAVNVDSDEGLQTEHCLNGGNFV